MLLVSGRTLRDAEGAVTGAVTAAQDITRLRESEALVRAGEQRFELAFDISPVGKALCDPTGRFVRVNAALCELLGRSAEQLLGLRELDVTHAEDVGSSVRLAQLAGGGAASGAGEAGSGAGPGREDEDLTDAAPAGRDSPAGDRTGRDVLRLDKRYVRADGTWSWVEVTATSVADPAAGGAEAGARQVLLQARDVSDRYAAPSQRSRPTRQDPLTGIFNRRLLNERLTTALARLQQRPGTVALLFVGLDGFRAVNDAYGHQAGDQVLTEIAHRLVSRVRPGDTVARLGGDEFVILAEDLSDPTAVDVVAARIDDVFDQPVRTRAGDVAVRGSVGAVTTTDPDTHPASLLLRADAAMYAVRQATATTRAAARATADLGTR